MVGRVSSDDRIALARTVLALSQRNKSATAEAYRDYKLSWKGRDVTDCNILHRLATMHLDTFDLSPIKLESGDTYELRDVFESLRERKIPSWIEEGRRLGGLLIGVSAQAGLSITLSKQWAPIAKQALLPTAGQ